MSVIARKLYIGRLFSSNIIDLDSLAPIDDNIKYKAYVPKSHHRAFVRKIYEREK